MKIEHVYVRPDGVICACTVPVPKEPRRSQNLPCDNCHNYCECNATKKEYEQALQSCKDSAVRFEDQHAINIMIPCEVWEIKTDSFYSVQCEVNIVEQYWTGNALSKNSRLPDWMDLHPESILRGWAETRKVARLITNSKENPVEEESQEDMLGEILQNYSDYRSDQGSGENIRPLITFIDEELEKFHITRKK